MAEILHVLIVDDCAPLRTGLRQMLEQVGGGMVVGEAENGSAALASLAQTQWDVVLLDVRMPDLCGMQVAEIVREQGHPARILAFSSHADDEYIRGMLASGAVGKILSFPTG